MKYPEATKILSAITAMFLGAHVAAQTPTDKNAYFGELHLHTAYSLDAYIFGTTMNDPFTAYRFAKGEEVTLPTGVKKRIKAPLDFTAITDHSEALGEYEICTDEEMAGYTSSTCKGIRNSDMKIFQDIFAGMAITPPQAGGGDLRRGRCYLQEGGYRAQAADPGYR